MHITRILFSFFARDTRATALIFFSVVFPVNIVMTIFFD